MRAALATLLILVVALAGRAGESDVVRGPARLRFEGARAFTGEELAEVVRLDIEGYVRSGFDEIHAEDAADHLQRHYLSEGHAEVTVEYVSTPEEAKRGLMRIEIDEGPRILLGKVKLKGNDSVPDETLLAFVRRKQGWFGSPVLVRSRLESDLGAMEDYYAQNGWLEIEIAPFELKLKGEPGEAEVVGNVVVRIAEGPRTWFSPEDVEIAGARDVAPEELRATVRALVEDALDETGRMPYRPGIRNRVRAALLDRFGTKGYPFATVRVEEVLSPEKDRIRLVCHVDEGGQARVSHIEVEGNVGVPDFWIRRELEFDRDLSLEKGGTIDTGAIFHAGRVRNAQRSLLRTGLFTSVRIDPVPSEGDPERVDLRVKVRERELRTLDLSLGWGSYEQARAGITLNHRAWNGLGDLLGLDWSLKALQSRLEVDVSTKHVRTGAQVRDRRIFGTRWEAALLSGFEARENVSYSYTRVGTRLAFGRKLVEWDRRVRVEAAWTLTHTEIIDVDDELPEGLEETVNLSSLSAGVIGDWRNDPIWPGRGFRVSLHLEDADDRLLGDESFVRVKVAGEAYLPLDESETWVVALAARTGFLFPYGDTDEIPLSERFFSGGSTSVRSFDEQELGPKKDGSPAGGEAEFVANAELRFPLWKIIHGAAFVDAGNVYRDTGDFDPGDVELGIGAGIRLRTPVGPFRLDWGWNPDPGEDDPDWTIHFSVGFAF